MRRFLMSLQFRNCDSKKSVPALLPSVVQILDTLYCFEWDNKTTCKGMFRDRLRPETFGYALTFSPEDKTLKFIKYVQS